MLMKDRKLLPLIVSFLVFSMLLNCMGIMILQLPSRDISYKGLGFLEAFKDLPIALASIFFVGTINKKGTKEALLFSMILVSVACFLLPLVNAFWFFKLWFAIIGVGFAIAKISIYGLLKDNFQGKNQLPSALNKVEAAFMIGIFAVNIGFGWLLTSAYADYWMFGFWAIALLAFLNVLLIKNCNYISNVNFEQQPILERYKQIFNTRTALFFGIIFFIVFTEQCFNSWLPAFYKQNFNLNSFYALQSSAFLALFSFIGRWLTSRFIRSFSWYRYMMFCLVMALLILILVYLSMTYMSDYFFLVYFIPLIGLFISPLYPVINSRMLLEMDQNKTNLMVSAVVVFSSLGSSFGSIYISQAFHLGKSNLFSLYIIVPILLVMLFTFIFDRNIVSK